MSLIPRLTIVASAAVCFGPLASTGIPPTLVRTGQPPTHAANSVQYRQELMLERDFPVGAGGTLVIDVPDGDVEVLPGLGGRVSVKVFVGARDPEWGRSVFERMRFDVRADGNAVRVAADNPRIQRSEWRRNRGISVRISVEVPSVFNTEIVTHDGDIEVGDLEGRMEIRSHDGDITLGRLRGPEISIRTSDGDIRARALEAETIELDTKDGDVEIREVSGALRASTGDGDIRVYLAAPKEIRLRTRDGDISIFADRGLKANLDLYGDDLDLGSAFRVDAGRVSRRGVSGSLNGGGPLLEARTVDGSIALRRR